MKPDHTALETTLSNLILGKEDQDYEIPEETWEYMREEYYTAIKQKASELRMRLMDADDILETPALWW